MVGRPLLVVVTLLSLSLAGCVAPMDASIEPAATSRVLPSELVEATFLPPIELGTSEVGAEPNVAIAPNGTIYVTDSLALWRSTDGGRSYEGIGESSCLALPCHSPKPGIDGGGDGSLATDSNGTLHWAGLHGANETQVPYQRSTDGGATWSAPHDVAESNNATDREWVTVDALDRIHVIWRDLGNVSDDCIYIPTRDTCYVDPTRADPETLQWARSVDGGATWSRAVIGQDAIAGPLVADVTSSALYVPAVRDGVRIIRSLDDGATWEEVVVVPGVPLFGAQIFPVAAVDQAGTLYVVWSYDTNNPLDPAAGIPDYGPSLIRATARPGVFLSVSHDRGATFSAPLLISTPDTPAVMPWIDAGAPGRIVVAWYEAIAPTPSDRAPNLWNVRVAMSTTASAEAPEIGVWTATPEPHHIGSICTAGLFCTVTGGDRSLLDFFEVRIHPDGYPVLAYAADHEAKMGLVRVLTTRMETGTPLR